MNCPAMQLYFKEMVFWLLFTRFSSLSMGEIVSKELPETVVMWYCVSLHLMAKSGWILWGVRCFLVAQVFIYVDCMKRKIAFKVCLWRNLCFLFLCSFEDKIMWLWIASCHICALIVIHLLVSCFYSRQDFNQFKNCKKLLIKNMC